MPKTQPRFYKNLILWEKTIEKAPKIGKYKVFGLCFILSLTVGVLVGWTFQQRTISEIAQKKQEISNIERRQMDNRIEKFKNKKIYN